MRQDECWNWSRKRWRESLKGTTYGARESGRTCIEPNSEVSRVHFAASAVGTFIGYLYIENVRGWMPQWAANEPLFKINRWPRRSSWNIDGRVSWATRARVAATDEFYRTLKCRIVPFLRQRRLFYERIGITSCYIQGVPRAIVQHFDSVEMLGINFSMKTFSYERLLRQFSNCKRPQLAAIEILFVEETRYHKLHNLLV